MKDHFSRNAAGYAKFRPDYPPAFFDYLRRLPVPFDRAWDCGTGNGQLAGGLAAIFKEVHATDISQQQLDHAVAHPRIRYSLQPAEKTGFPPGFFDLVIAGQAVHWFQFEKFYEEVRRTTKEHALLVLVGYNLPLVSPEVDAIIQRLYTGILGSYWDPERKYVDASYRTLPFPFEAVEAPDFENRYTWSLEHLEGYLRTWSALQHFTERNGFNPIGLVIEDLHKAWGNAPEREVYFPLLLRIGRVHHPATG